MDIVEKDGLTELLKLASSEFVKAMTIFGDSLKLDIEKLTVIQKEKDQEILSNYDRQLNFLENHKNENISDEMRKEIYNDFNKVAMRLNGYQIQVYKDAQKEKITKQVVDGVIKVVTVATIGQLLFALIKKIK